MAKACDQCDPSFGCFSDPDRCCKRHPVTEPPFPAYSHTRDDGRYSPCSICAQQYAQWLMWLAEISPLDLARHTLEKHKDERQNPSVKLAYAVVDQHEMLEFWRSTAGALTEAHESHTQKLKTLAEQLSVANEAIYYLEERRTELLATVRRISQETPLPEELEGWESQRAALIAEVGTLRAECHELRGQLQTAILRDHR